jgi:hypothetical protein
MKLISAFFLLTLPVYLVRRVIQQQVKRRFEHRMRAFPITKFALLLLAALLPGFVNAQFSLR